MWQCSSAHARAPHACTHAAAQKERPLGSEPWFNPEGVTAAKVELGRACWRGGGQIDPVWLQCPGRTSTPCGSKLPPFPRPVPQREWLEAHQAQQPVGGHQWPPNIFENFYIVVRGRS